MVKVQKFDTNVAKGLKLKVIKFLGLILTFPEVTGEKLVGGNRVNILAELLVIPNSLVLIGS